MSTEYDPRGEGIPSPPHPTRREAPLPGHEPKSEREQPGSPERVRAVIDRLAATPEAKGREDEESYADYILGRRDGQPKTPEWAEAITTVPRDVIARIAREYATAKAAVLYQGYGMQRRAYGEQVVRAGCTLAAITGNVGIPGGWASGIALQAGGGPFWNVFPVLENPVQAQIPTFLWTEAILRGPELTDKEGLVGIDRLPHGIKLVWAVASNCIVNQHANVNRTIEIIRDTSLLEYFIVQDQFMTPTARFADLVLPACTQFETWGLEDGWKYGEEVILQPQILDPPWETKSDYAICAAVAEKLGIHADYTQGRNEKQWVSALLDEYRRLRFPDLPTLEEFEEKNLGVYSRPVEKPKIAFEDFRKNPEKVWAMRRLIFGLGSAQMLVTATLLAAGSSAVSLAVLSAVVSAAGSSSKSSPKASLSSRSSSISCSTSMASFSLGRITAFRRSSSSRRSMSKRLTATS